MLTARLCVLKIPSGSKVVIDASRTVNIDYDVREIIAEFATNAHYRDIDLEIINPKKKKVRNQIKQFLSAVEKHYLDDED